MAYIQKKLKMIRVTSSFAVGPVNLNTSGPAEHQTQKLILSTATKAVTGMCTCSLVYATVQAHKIKQKNGRQCSELIFTVTESQTFRSQVEKLSQSQKIIAHRVKQPVFTTE